MSQVHLVVIYGPDGNRLKRVYVEGQDPHELLTDEEQQRAMEHAMERV